MNENQIQDIKFFKLNTTEDIVAFVVNEDTNNYVIQKPLVISIENDLSTGKQSLDAREWVPPVVCESNTTNLPKSFVVMKMDVLESFKKEFIRATDFLYRVEPVTEESENVLKENNILPFMVIKSKTDKPN